MLLIFFFNDTATTEIYTLSLHDALPIFANRRLNLGDAVNAAQRGLDATGDLDLELGRCGARLADRHGSRWKAEDRKSTRLNSSHANISYAVFCLKKKKTN